MNRKPVRNPKQMDLMASQKDEWLRQARIAAERIAFETGSVTAEDIRKSHPVPSGVNKNVMGKLFADRTTFRSDGYKKSTTGSRKGGIILIWKLTEKAEAHWRSHYGRVI